jgi:acyl dehydratase
MRTFSNVDELSGAVGTELGRSEWRLITQHQIDLFAEATGDHQWIHVDAERAASGPFGATVAHGYLTLSLIPSFAAEIFTVTGLTMAVNYGLDKVRFPAPVPVGSRLRAAATLLDVSQTPAGWQALNRVTVEIEGGAKPACVAETRSLLVP